MKLTAKAYAKINLSLDIKGVLDNGYHLIDTVMQTVDIFDEISVSDECEGIKFSCSCPDISYDDNLCVSAAKMFFDFAGIKGNADIILEKNIPVASGMGGGSSNAAAVLLLLNRIYGEKFNKKQLEHIAMSLGADVPFFLYGSTYRAGGIGEKLQKIDTNLDYGLIIIKNQDKISTGTLYKKLDTVLNVTTSNTEKLVVSLKRGDYKSMCENAENNFSLVWDYDKIKNKLKADKCSVSGSGPTVFGIYRDYETAKKVYCNIKNEYEHCFLTKPIGHSFEIIE